MRFYKAFLQAVCMMAVVSCTERIPAGDGIPCSTVTLQAVLGGDVTRATVSQSGTAAWSASDRISVFTTKNTVKTLNLVGESDGIAEFSGEMDADEMPSTIAVYPSSSFRSLEGQTLTVNYPGTYSYSENILPGPMAAGIEGHEMLIFKHLGGLLSISCNEVPAAAAQFFVAAAGSRLNGDFSVDIEDGMRVQTEAISGNSKTCVDFVNDGSARTFNIPVPAGRYQCIYAAFTDASGNKIKEWEVTGDVTVERGDMFVRSMPSDMIRLATFNNLYSYSSDSHTWENRRPNVIAAFPTRHIDIMGSQENTSGQINDLLSAVSGYSATGKSNAGKEITNVGYDSNLYEIDAIYWNRKRITCLEAGTFWFSASPDVQSNCKCCNWAKFAMDGKPFYIFNVHLQVGLDDKSRLKRLEQAEILAERIKTAAASCPVILTGDMNTTAEDDSDAVCYLIREAGLRDARGLVSAPHGPIGTINYFKTDNATRRIDYILVSSRVKVHSYWVDSRQQSTGLWESDHNPVISDISFD